MTHLRQRVVQAQHVVSRRLPLSPPETPLVEKPPEVTFSVSAARRTFGSCELSSAPRHAQLARSMAKTSDSRSSTSAYAFPPLQAAALDDRVAEIADLLASGQDPNKRDFTGNTPLFYASSQRSPHPVGLQNGIEICRARTCVSHKTPLCLHASCFLLQQFSDTQL